MVSRASSLAPVHRRMCLETAERIDGAAERPELKASATRLRELAATIEAWADARPTETDRKRVMDEVWALCIEVTKTLGPAG